MVELGLLAGDVDELIAERGLPPLYMHSTSHWLGLDVHDVGAYAAGGKPRALEPGMVLHRRARPLRRAPTTRARPRALRGIGVRIEDDVLVTASGCENLTAAIPKHPADVEAWMRELGESRSRRCPTSSPC